MKEENGPQPLKVDAFSFDKLLSDSRIMRSSILYGKCCCLKEINTDTDRDIFKYPIKINAYILVVCSEGLIELTCNLHQLTLSANSMFIYNPGTIVRINALEPSRLAIMVFTREFIDQLGIKLDNIPLQQRIINDRHSFVLSQETCHQLQSMMRFTGNYIGMDKSNTYYNELVQSSFKSLIYRALYEMNDQYDAPVESRLLPTQENSHFDRFMRLLQNNYKSHHSIRFYADKMGLSPKYLSLIIKKVSGKLATEWIDEYIILEAKNLIKYSSMSIQEISYALNFPNQSFFGKFFKRHTGLSPKAYRMQP